MKLILLIKRVEKNKFPPDVLFFIYSRVINTPRIVSFVSEPGRMELETQPATSSKTPEKAAFIPRKNALTYLVDLKQYLATRRIWCSDSIGQIGHGQRLDRYMGIA